MMKPSLQLRIGQQLAMTPQLQQAIRLLQLPTLELQAQVLQALESNVMLEAEDETGSLETGEVEAGQQFAASAPSAETPEAASPSATERTERESDLDIADDHAVARLEAEALEGDLQDDRRRLTHDHLDGAPGHRLDRGGHPGAVRDLAVLGRAGPVRIRRDQPGAPSHRLERGIELGVVEGAIERDYDPAHQRIAAHLEPVGAELGDLMTGNCTVIRENQKLKATEDKIVEYLDRWQKVRSLDGSRHANQSLMYVRHLHNMLILARAIVRGALLRDESRGAHYKPEFPKRDDARFLKTTIARYVADGDGVDISYEPVDTSLIPPRERKYDTEKKTKAA